MATVDLLRATQLLSSLDDAGLERLAALAVEVQFPEGAEILREGEIGLHFYVIAAGLVDVVAGALDGDKTVATLGSGALFGELSALMGQRRGASVRAVADTVALRFPAGGSMEILRDYPSVLSAIEELGRDRANITTDRVLGIEE